MSKSRSLESILDQAKEREKKYDWVKAAEQYKQALRLVEKADFLRKGEIQERIGFCFQRATFQAESQEEFRKRMQQAILEYKKAHGFFEKLTDEQKARMSRCKAIVKYLGYWLMSNPAERRLRLDECWQMATVALEAFEEAGDRLEYGKTYNKLSSVADPRVWLEWHFQTGKKIIREAIEFGEKAITLLSRVNDAYELARAYVKTARFMNMFCYYFTPGTDEKKAYSQKSLDYWKKAMGLSEEAALLELISTVGEDFLGWSINEKVAHYEKALGYAEKTRDRYLIGSALDWLAFSNFWKAQSIDDPDKSVDVFQIALQCAENAKHQFSTISYVSPRGGVLWSEAPHVELYWSLSNLETDLKKRRDLLEKAVADETQVVELAENSGYPGIIGYSHHALSKALGSFGLIETNIEEKKRLLEKALEHRKEVIKNNEQFGSFDYWDQGVSWNYLADLKAELSNVGKDSENMKSLLEEAVSDKERCLQLCNKEKSYFPVTVYAVLGRYQYSYGELLNRLYGVTNNKEHQEKARKAFEEAAESFQKLEMVSRVAECYWKAARGCDALGQHLRAVENFNVASNNYTIASKKIPQLNAFYADHAIYMEAWSEIERAKRHHAEKQYGQAREHYEKAASLHKATERWKYLSSNYLALARVEEAEDLSRREQAEEARDLFQTAAKLFAEAKESIEVTLEKIEARDEKEMATELAKASDVRKEYCLGRIVLEEAKILDRQGDHTASSRKYGFAAERFQKTIDAMEGEADRRELKPIVDLCHAWQMMTQAEAEASPDLYLEASRLFDEAKEHTLDQKAKILALGHSSFCKALEAGTRFEATGDMAIYSSAKKHLEAAAKYYLKAGFQTASEYARGAHRLFDAYMYMNKAEAETEPGKKAQYFQMTERLLQTSAGSYMKAKHPEKSEEVQRLLQSVKEERQLAMSLSEVLHVPSTASTTTSFSTPTPTHEQAIGLERFEHADIQANLKLRVKDVKVGEDVSLAIELVNAGKAPALLIKVDEIVPEGFEIKEVPEIYTVEDSYINMKGKRLNPLKTEDVKIIAKPLSKGVFMIEPRILYIDETGKYKSHDPEPVTITVKELGIKGWVKGER